MITKKCINCRKEIEEARLTVLGHTSLCTKCAHKMGTQHEMFPHDRLRWMGGVERKENCGDAVLFIAKSKKVPNSQLVFSVIREDTIPRVITPFKRLRKPTLGVIRNGDLWTTQVPITRSINRVVDDYAACSYDFSDSSCEFYTGVPGCSNGNP